MPESMGNQTPWISILSAAEQEACANEILIVTTTSLETREPELVLDVLATWHERARVIATSAGQPLA